MSFHPPINTFEDLISAYNRTNACNDDCCTPPTCPFPILECEQMMIGGCFFTHKPETENEEDCWFKYLTKTYGWNINNVDGDYGLVVNITITETYSPVAKVALGNSIAPCELEYTCDISGFGSTPTEIRTLSNYAGLPDPRWVPAEGQTEDDRPILPENGCYAIWEVVPTIGDIYYEDFYYDTSHPDYFEEYSDPIDCSELRDAAIALEFEKTNDTCEAYYYCPECAQFAEMSLSKLRYKWIVPPCHTGSYFKIQWQEIFFPKAYLDWYNEALAFVDPTGGEDILNDGITFFDPNANPPPELPVITAKEWEWEGLNLGECDNTETNDYQYRLALESRKSPWSNIVICPSEGVIQIHNIQIYCYRSPFGNKPHGGGGNYNYSTNDVDQDGILDSEEPIPQPDPPP